jgi:hypothetical protein
VLRLTPDGMNQNNFDTNDTKGDTKEIAFSITQNP